MDRAVKAIIKKDIRQIFHNKQVLMPMLIVPLVFSIFLPLTSIVPALQEIAAETQGASAEDIQQLMMIVNGFKGFLLLIPLMAASIVASNAIVGEKERKTLETLLYSPVPSSKIFLAKCLAAFIVSMVMTVISAVIFSSIINYNTMQTLGKIMFTGVDWLIIICLLTPAITLLGIFFMVLVSAKAKSFQAAQQWSLIIMFPMLVLIMIQSAGVIAIPVYLYVIIGCGILALDFLLIIKGLGKFTRPQLMDAKVSKKDMKKMSLTGNGMGLK